MIIFKCSDWRQYSGKWWRCSKPAILPGGDWCAFAQDIKGMSLKVLGRGEVVVIFNYDNLLFNIQLRGQQEKIKEVIKKMCEKVNDSKKKKTYFSKRFSPVSLQLRATLLFSSRRLASVYHCHQPIVHCHRSTLWDGGSGRRSLPDSPSIWNLRWRRWAASAWCMSTHCSGSPHSTCTGLTHLKSNQDQRSRLSNVLYWTVILQYWELQQVKDAEQETQILKRPPHFQLLHPGELFLLFWE